MVYRTMDFYSELASKYNLKVSSVGVLKDLGHVSGQELADKQMMLAFTKS